VGLVLVVAVFVPAATTAASAASCTTSWKSAVDGDWSVASNWSNGVPSSSSIACIAVAGTYTVTVQQIGNFVKSLVLGVASGTQTLDVLGSCQRGSASVAVSTGTSIGSHGALRLDSSGCASGGFVESGGTLLNDGRITLFHAQLDGQSPGISGTVVNAGTIDVKSQASVWGSWTNNGTIDLADGATAQVQQASTVVNNGAIKATGTGTLVMYRATFVQESGTTSGQHPIAFVGGTLADNGRGKATFRIDSDATTLTGNIASGQTVLLDGSCVNHVASLYAPADWTNNGTVLLAADGACNERAIIVDRGTFTNEGVIAAFPLSATNARVEIENGVFQNNGTLTVAPGATLFGSPARLVNGANATVTVDVASATRYGSLNFTSGPHTALTLSGTLTVSTPNTYWPPSGLTLPILVSGSPRAGTFANITGVTRAGQSVAYHLAYTTNGANLTTS